MVISQAQFEESFKGYIVIDACTGNNNSYTFLLEEALVPDHSKGIYMEDLDFKTRIIQTVLKPNQLPENKVLVEFSLNEAYPNIAGNKKIDGFEYIICTCRSTVISLTASNLRVEEPHNAFDMAVPSKTINIGETIFVIGSRNIIRRLGLNDWKLEDVNVEGKFQDMAGTDLEHMCAVGGKGLAWMYDDKKWQKIEFPSNEDLRNVAYASENEIYIASRLGNIWRGNKDKWEQIIKTENTYGDSFEDIFWFQGKLYCAGNAGFFVLENDKLTDCNSIESFPKFNKNERMRIDVNNDKTKMVVTDYYQAAVYDGENWEVIFSSNRRTI